jgi:hypothetical protein
MVGRRDSGSEEGMGLEVRSTRGRGHRGIWRDM